jgi:hypothetical protein
MHTSRSHVGDRLMARHHQGGGGHVVRIYDESLWRRLKVAAAEQDVYVSVGVAAALIEYFDRHTEPDPAYVVGLMRLVGEKASDPSNE